MVIVGLGNPGSKYEQTRHNVGFMFVDRLAESYNASFVLDKQKVKNIHIYLILLKKEKTSTFSWSH